MQEIDTGKPEDGEPFAMDVRELLDHVGDRRLYEVLKLSLIHIYFSFSNNNFCNGFNDIFIDELY